MTERALPPSITALHAGLFDITTAQRGEIIEAATIAQRCIRSIDACGARDKSAVLARIAQALDFPQWFGHNWDALSDCLSDLSWLPPQTGYVFVLNGCSDHTEAMPILREIFDQACADWSEQGTAMSVFVVKPETEK